MYSSVTNTKKNSVKQTVSNEAVEIMKEKKKLKNVSSIFKESQTSIIADIANAKSRWEILEKISIFFFCVIGFLWHFRYFVILYTSYRTVRKEITTEPSLFEKPAFTLCNINPRYRTSVYYYQPEQFTELEPSIFCEEYPQYCSPGERFQPFVFKENVKCSKDCISWEEMIKQRQELLILNDENDEYLENSLRIIRKVPYIANDGEPILCFNYGVQAADMKEYGNIYSSSYEEAKIISTRYNWWIYLAIYPTDYLDPWQNISIYMAIHDGKRRVNPFKDGFKLPFLQEHDISVTEAIEIKRLPAPFDTNCTDYLKIWHENNRTGPVTTLDCVEQCELSRLLQENKCIPRTIGLPHFKPLCDGNEVVPQDILMYCLDQCGPPCMETIYKYDIRSSKLEIEPLAKIYTEEDGYHEDWDDIYHRFKTIRIRISFRRFRKTEVVFEPSLRGLDFFSNLGGYLGIWIGTSLVTFLDILYLISLTVYQKICPKPKKRRNAKK